MKLINSKDEIFEEDTTDLFDETEYYGPCWEARVDRIANQIIMLIDNKEIASCSLSNFEESEITVEKLSEFIVLLRDGDLKTLKKAMKNRK